MVKFPINDCMPQFLLTLIFFFASGGMWINFKSD